MQRTTQKRKIGLQQPEKTIQTTQASTETKNNQKTKNGKKKQTYWHFKRQASKNLPRKNLETGLEKETFREKTEYFFW